MDLVSHAWSEVVDLGHEGGHAILLSGLQVRRDMM
jgi:hypothetical protein